MTKKEALYREYVELMIKLDPNTDVTVEEHLKIAFPNAYTIKELEGLIQNTKDRLGHKKKKMLNEKFLTETEEGIKFNKEQTTARERYLKEIDGIYERLSKFVNDKVVRMLGDNWTSTVTADRIEIGLKNTDPERNGFAFEFGHSFDITFNTWGHPNGYGNLSANYGSMGAFNLLTDDNRRVEYIVGMGKVLSNNELLEMLKVTMSNVNDKLSDLRKKIDTIDKDLVNAAEKFNYKG